MRRHFDELCDNNSSRHAKLSLGSDVYCLTEFDASALRHDIYKEGASLDVLGTPLAIHLRSNQAWLLDLGFIVLFS